MPDSIMYHEGNRRLQDQFDSRRISDRLEEKLTRTAFTADDKAFIESVIYFFVATADAEGRPDCSFKGGAPGFVRVIATGRAGVLRLRRQRHVQEPRQSAGEPQRRSALPRHAREARRLRVNGQATVSREDPLLADTVGAQLIVRVKARAIFPNCPRYIPKLQLAEPSKYVPQPGQDPVEPAWKGFADFKDYVHPRQVTFKRRAARIDFAPGMRRGSLGHTAATIVRGTPMKIRPALSALLLALARLVRRARRSAAHDAAGERRPLLPAPAGDRRYAQGRHRQGHDTRRHPADLAARQDRLLRGHGQPRSRQARRR